MHIEGNKPPADSVQPTPEVMKVRNDPRRRAEVIREMEERVRSAGPTAAEQEILALFVGNPEMREVMESGTEQMTVSTDLARIIAAYQAAMASGLSAAKKEDRPGGNIDIRA